MCAQREAGFQTTKMSNSSRLLMMKSAEESLFSGVHVVDQPDEQ